MSFPVSKQGAPGFDKEMTSGKKHRIGTRMQFPDGRVFYYGVAAEAITAGKVTMMNATNHADHITDLAIPAAYAAGVSQITITNSGAAVTGTGRYTGDFTTLGTYEDGYVFVNDAAGEGQTWQIMDHSSAGASATITVDFYPNDTVRTALTTSSQVGIAENIMAAVNAWDVNDIDGPVCGVPTCDQTSGYYGWYQTAGPCAVLTNGTVVLGKNVMTGSTTDGSVDVMADDSSAEFLIGGVINVAATTEYSLVDLQIRY
jgi:hypothetical protein